MNSSASPYGQQQQLPFRVMNEALSATTRTVCCYGPLLFASARSSSSTGSDCPLFCWDVRKLAGAAALAVERAATATAAAAASGGAKTAAPLTAVQGPASFLFQTELFERERAGERQSFPVEKMAILAPVFSAVNTTTTATTMQGSNSSNILRFAVASTGPTFKVCAYDRSMDMTAAMARHRQILEENQHKQQHAKQQSTAADGFRKRVNLHNPPPPTPVQVLCESPSGDLGAANPLVHKGHCQAITSLACVLNDENSSVLSASVDGTARLWRVVDDRCALECIFAVRHGLSGQFSRTSRIVAGGAPSSASSVGSNRAMIFTAGQDDGRVMLWDSRQKFVEGMPALHFLAAAAGEKLKNLLALSNESGASLFVARTDKSLAVFDARRLQQQQQQSFTPLFTPIVLPLASSEAIAAPLCFGFDEKAAAPTAICTFDANPADAQWPDERVAVVSLVDGRLLHSVPLGLSGGASANHIATLTRSLAVAACSDGTLRFCDVQQPSRGSASECWWKILSGNGQTAALRRDRD